MSIRLLVREARQLMEASGAIQALPVEKLRKDFLLLLKNVDRVKSLATAQEFRQAVMTWRAYLARVVAQAIETAKTLSAVPYPQPHAADWVPRIQTDTWALLSTMSEIPIERMELVKQLRPDATEAELFRDFEQGKEAWAKKAKKAALPAWKALDAFAAWAAAQGQTSAVEPSGPVQLEIEGFKVRVHDLDADPLNREHLERFRAALKIYRARAKRVFPWLIRNALPIEVDFVCGQAAGNYMQTYVRIAALQEPAVMAKVLAHEMGHHVWNKYLSAKDQSFWEATIHADFGAVDLRRLLALRKPGDKYLTALLTSSLKERDPVLYLHAHMLVAPHSAAPVRLQTFDELEARIADGKPTMDLPRTPISAYGSFSPEEGFCEAFGILVGYGPQAVQPDVRQWLLMILPDLHVEGRASTPLADLVFEARVCLGAV